LRSIGIVALIVIIFLALVFIYLLYRGPLL